MAMPERTVSCVSTLMVFGKTLFRLRPRKAACSLVREEERVKWIRVREGKIVTDVPGLRYHDQRGTVRRLFLGITNQSLCGTKECFPLRRGCACRLHRAKLGRVSRSQGRTTSFLFMGGSVSEGDL